MGKISSYTLNIAPSNTDYLAGVNSGSGGTERFQVDGIASLIAQADWISITDGLTYSSFNSSTYIGVVSTATDWSDRIGVGSKIRLTQSTPGTIYGYVTAITGSTITIRFLDGVTFASETITSPVYSNMGTPIGFPGGEEGYREIARTTLASAGDTINVSDIPPRKYLRVIIHIIQSGTNDVFLTFNSDSGNNYALSVSANFTSSAETTDNSELKLVSSGTAEDKFIVVDIINNASSDKFVIAHVLESGGGGSGTAPDSREIFGQWNNSVDSVDEINLANSDSGSYDSVSEAIVMGKN